MSIFQNIRTFFSGVLDIAKLPQQLVFLTPIDTQLNDFLEESHRVVCFDPSILEQIDQDLDLLAKRKKLLRLADAQFIESQTADLPELQVQLRAASLDSIELETGRPRTAAYVVFIFLMLRGFGGGCKDQRARLLLEESMTIKLWLERLGMELPPPSTLSDNLNAVSNQTREYLLEVQLRYAAQQELDDFKKCFIDSTAVEANSARPTDSSLMVRLIERICTLGANLGRFELPAMNQIGLEVQQAELRRDSQQILFLNGKGRTQNRRKRLYFQFIRKVRRLRKRLLRDFELPRQQMESRRDILPSRRLAAQEVLDMIAGDLADLEKAAAACERRVMTEEKVPVEEKIISLSDQDASFIVKGGWDSILGYRPQLARSGQGLVTALILPQGNAADSPQLAAMVEAQISHTGTVPSVVSVDDGYSSQQGRDEVLAMGVGVVSISGAKGKKLLEAQQWKSSLYRQARAERSAMESLMFTLKDGFEFGSLKRRTREHGLAEMLEKVLAYNITQIIRIRTRKRQSEAKAAPALAA